MNLVEFNRQLIDIRSARTSERRNRAKFNLLAYYEEVSTILLESKHMRIPTGWDAHNCATCHVLWPCPTIANLTGEKTGEQRQQG